MTYVALETKTKRLLLSEFNPATLQNRIIVDSSILTDSLSSTFIAIDPYLLTRSDGTAGVVNTSGEIKSIESIPVLGVGCRRTFAPHLAGLTVPLLAWVDQCPAQSFVGWFDIGTNTPTLVQTVSSGPILNSISRDQQWIIFFSRNGQGYHANALHRRSRHFIDLGSFVPSHLAWSN